MTSVRRLLVLVAVACIALVALQMLDRPAPATAAKLIASTGFILIALRCGATSSVYGRLVLLGLVFSWFGDLFLASSARQAFLAGLAAFLLAHLAYVAAFVRHGYRRGWTLAAAIPVTAIAIAVWTWLAPHTPADLSIPVRAYIAAISLMVIFAVGTRGREGSMLIVGGAVLFFFSDLSVAALRLVHTAYPTFVVGLPLYYSGQVCFALSVSQSRSH